MKKFNKDISVVFPAFNEEENIEACVIIANVLLRELVKDFEIIIVNDGSTDTTQQICNDLAKRFKNTRIITKAKNEGYGFALRDGFKAAQFDLVFFSDSDRQFDILNIGTLLEYIDDFDIVIGYRKNRQDNWSRKFLSWGYNVFLKLLFQFRFKDIDCAFKLFRRRIFDVITIESPRYFVNTEILAKAYVAGFLIKEVGVSHFPRIEGRSKVGFSDIPRTLKELARIYSSITFSQRKSD